jgi:hypothetical protein
MAKACSVLAFQQLPGLPDENQKDHLHTVVGEPSCGCATQRCLTTGRVNLGPDNDILWPSMSEVKMLSKTTVV